MEWQAPVNVPAHEVRRVEFEVDDGPETPWDGVPEVGGGWELCLTTHSSRKPWGHEVVTNLDMVGWAPGDYWITPTVGGESTLDSVIVLVPGRVGEVTGLPRQWPTPQRIEAISPELLPSTPLGWEPAGRVIVDASILSALSRTTRDALMAWVASGGNLVITNPASRLPHAVQRLGSGTVSGSTPIGTGLLRLRWYPIVDLHGHSLSTETATDILLRKASAIKPKLRVPRAQVLTGWGIGYLLLFGPVGLGLMRRSRRIVVIWLIVPALAFAATLVVLFATCLLAEPTPPANTGTVGVVPSGASTGEQQSDLIFFTSKPGSFSINIGTQTLSDAYITNLGGPWMRDVCKSGEHQLVFDDMPSYGKREVTLFGPVTIHGNLTVVIRPDGSGRLENNTSETLRASFVAVGARRALLPELAAHGHYELQRSDWLEVNPSTTTSKDSRTNPQDLVFPAHSAYWAVPNSRWLGIPEDPAGGGQRQSILLVDCGPVDLKLK